ncbi:MAG: hypothetical protein JWM92_417 [Candidatus Nomurabacteria bacterium]|nr:hypothetical protein [Candidatus Nomurabacteria bacterium]
MKTTTPTLDDMEKIIISCLTNDQLPEQKDALKFFNLIKDWDTELIDHKKRQIFKTILKTFKRRCVSKDLIKRQNEMWKTINAILPVWRSHKSTILVTGNKKKKNASPALFTTFSFNPFKDPDYEGLTLTNH